jgi:hypothetical protein
MKKLYYTFIFIFLFILNSCNENERKRESIWAELPEVTSLDSLKHTQFAITLENPILENKNVIYAPAFLFAWDALKKELKTPFDLIAPLSNDFKLLNESKSYENSLKPDEYDVNVLRKDGRISAYAYFNKTLPFPHKLEKLEEPIVFGNTKVHAFGMKYYDYLSVEFTNILYYKNDDNFILKFSPKNEHHEIILVKGLDSVSTLADALRKINVLIGSGKQEQKNEDVLWKYIITQHDIFSIPVIKFNISTQYKTVEKQKFRVGDESYDIDTACQRTGFILNENGAVVESEAFLEGAAAESETIQRPKKMIFDKPFYIVIKRIDQVNPYFVMKVDNTELMSEKSR